MKVLKKIRLTTILVTLFSMVLLSAFNIRKDNKAHLMRMELVKYSIEEQRQLYKELSAEKKYMLWNDKIKTVLSLPLKREQRAHLNLMYNNFSPNFFTHGSEEYIMFNQKHDSWVEKGKVLFGEDIMREIVASLADIDKPQFILATYKGEKYMWATCDCSKTSDWCSNGKKCGGSCTPPNPNSTQCGTFWQYYCDGICNLIE